MKPIPDVHQLKNILILRGEGSLGDAICSSCCYREIKKANPKIKITVACFGPSYPYFQQNSYVDEVVKLPVRTLIRPNQRWFSLIWAGLKLRRKHFDLVLDSSQKAFWNWRLFKTLIGGYRLDFLTSPVQPFGTPTQHASVHEQAILTLLGIQNPDGAYDLPVPPATEQQVNAWLTKQSISSYVLLNPSGSVAARQFSKETLHRLVQALSVLQRPFIVPAMPFQREHWEHVFANIPHVYVKQTADIFELFELIKRADLVVTPDTSVVHLAAGYHRPALIFYNQLSAYNAPNNDRAYIVQTERETVNCFDFAQLAQQVEAIKQNL